MGVQSGDGSQLEIAPATFWIDEYKVDWCKVKTIDDIKRLLEAAQLTFYGGNPFLKNIKDLVRKLD